MVGMVIDGQSMCRVSHEDTRTWWSSVSDLVQLLTQQADYQTARKYWNKLKESLSKEGSERMQEMADRALAPDQGPHLLAQFQSAPDINAGRSPCVSDSCRELIHVSIRARHQCRAIRRAESAVI